MLLVLLVCYTAVFTVVTQCSSPQEEALRDDSENRCVADYLCFLMPGLKFKIKLRHFQHSLVCLFFIFRWFGEIPKKLGQRGPFAKTKDLLFLSNTTQEATMSVTSVKTFCRSLLVLYVLNGLTLHPSLHGAQYDQPRILRSLQLEKG